MFIKFNAIDFQILLILDSKRISKKCRTRDYLANVGGATVGKLMRDGHVCCAAVVYGRIKIRK